MDGNGSASACGLQQSSKRRVFCISKSIITDHHTCAGQIVLNVVVESDPRQADQVVDTQIGFDLPLSLAGFRSMLWPNRLGGSDNPRTDIG